MKAPFADLAVLGSGSSGNASALVVGAGRERRVVLIDAGLSPTRTHAALRSAGYGAVPLGAVVLTHLDHDHWHPSWMAALPDRAAVWIHRRHVGRAERMGLARRRCEVFADDGAFAPIGPEVGVSSCLVDHDDLGAAALRWTFAGAGRTLAWATDVGRVTPALVRHVAGADVLAVESNYCPEMQHASDRPEFLKRRITGGRGHLSNAESAELVARARPRERVVLLHLSRQCNSPEAARAAHAGHGVPLVVSAADEPTPWLSLSDPGMVPRPSEPEAGEIVTMLGSPAGAMPGAGRQSAGGQLGLWA